MAAIPDAVRAQLDLVFRPEHWTHMQMGEIHTVDGIRILRYVNAPLRPGRVKSTDVVTIGPRDASPELKEACVAYVRQLLVAPWLRLLDVETISLSPDPHTEPESTGVIAYLTLREGTVAPGATTVEDVPAETVANEPLMRILISNALINHIPDDEQRLIARYLHDPNEPMQ